MWNLWNSLNTILMVIGIVGCGTAPPAELTVGPIVSTPSQVGDTPKPAPADPVTPDVVVNTVSVTYHTLSKTVAPIAGWPLKTYTATGNCVVYQSKTYCWDDDLQIMPSWTSSGFTHGPYYYTYWSLGYDTLNRLNICGGSTPANGGCAADVMVSPRTVAGNVASNIPSASINAVLAGPATHVTCTETNGVLDCGTFQIDLNQSPI